MRNVCLRGLRVQRNEAFEQKNAMTTRAIAPAYADTTSHSHAAVRYDSSPAEKISLFRSLFVGRADVYATRWTSKKTGKSGWSPAVRGGYYTDAVTDVDLLPLMDQVIERHLLGTRAAGSNSRK